VALFALAPLGCAGAPKPTEIGWLDGTDASSAGPAIRVLWSFDMDAASLRGASVPVQPAAPVIDSVTGRVYVGSTQRMLRAFDRDGRQLYRYHAPAAIEAEPTIDGKRGELYVATVTGELLALDADSGALRWQTSVGGPVSKPGLLRDDALYLVTDDDVVLALARKDGAILWRYKRDRVEGFAIAGHAGLVAAGKHLITGFGDGVVAALDVSDGRVLWETDTGVDLAELDPTRRFLDVDTTPAVIGDRVYVASFSGGVYALELDTGTVAHHDQTLTGVTSIAASQDALVVTSAERGVICFDLPRLTQRWRREVLRGAPGEGHIEGDRVFLPESLGGFIALSLADGQELGRIETAHGVTAGASMTEGLGALLSNGGRLYAFSYTAL
jgi:outer membrane protein assembly factor BamB